MKFKEHIKENKINEESMIDQEKKMAKKLFSQGKNKKEIYTEIMKEFGLTKAEVIEDLHDYII
jgi:hypothetical protein